MGRGHSAITKTIYRATSMHQSAYLGGLVRGVSVDAAGYGRESNTLQPVLLAEQQRILSMRHEAEQANKNKQAPPRTIPYGEALGS